MAECTAYRDPRLAEAHIASPLVSIIVTSFNYARYITHCLDGVRRQTYPNWECIIVDDQSTDETPAILADYLEEHQQDGKFRLLTRQTNGGQMEAFRDGLAVAQGTFVMMLDADDVLLPDFLETHVEVHLGYKAVAFTSSNQYQINEKSEIISGNHVDHLGKGHYRYVPQQVFQHTYWIWATASSMLFRRATLDLIMPAPGTTFRICADYYIAHFCQQIGNSILIPSVHGCYRRHEENNFSANPLVGAINSLGDISRHPPHEAFRRAIIQHILARFDRFQPIFGSTGILILLFRVATYKELDTVLRQHKGLFPGSRRQILCRYLQFHARRYFYDRSPWGKRLMVIAPPQREFAPTPPTPGKILSGTIRQRLAGLFTGEK